MIRQHGVPMTMVSPETQHAPQVEPRARVRLKDGREGVVWFRVTGSPHETRWRVLLPNGNYVDAWRSWLEPIA